MSEEIWSTLFGQLSVGQACHTTSALWNFYTPLQTWQNIGILGLNPPFFLGTLDPQILSGKMGDLGLKFLIFVISEGGRKNFTQLKVCVMPIKKVKAQCNTQHSMVRLDNTIISWYIRYRKFWQWASSKLKISLMMLMRAWF